MTDRDREKLKDAVQAEILALLDDHIENQIEIMGADCTVAEIAGEVLLEVKQEEPKQ